jgi:hypothetical protein
MAGFDHSSLDIFGAERLWRDLLPSALLEILKIDNPRSFTHVLGSACEGRGFKLISARWLL